MNFIVQIIFYNLDTFWPINTILSLTKINVPSKCLIYSRWVTFVYFLNHFQLDIEKVSISMSRINENKASGASQIWHCTHARPRKQVKRVVFLHSASDAFRSFWEIRISKMSLDSQLGSYLYFAQFQTCKGVKLLQNQSHQNLFRGCFGQRHKTCLG